MKNGDKYIYFSYVSDPDEFSKRLYRIHQAQLEFFSKLFGLSHFMSLT